MRGEGSLACVRTRAHAHDDDSDGLSSLFLSFFLFNSFASFLFSLSFENGIFYIPQIYHFESPGIPVQINRKNEDGDSLFATLRYIENERRNYCLHTVVSHFFSQMSQS